MKVIGLTGGIGSGKSTVAALLAGHGRPVIDADVIAREISGPGQPAQIEIARAWPVVDDRGVIDRKKLAAIVFSDEQSRKRLEAITHPHIRARVAEQAAALAKAGHPLAFLEAALLVETGFYRSLQGLVLVTAGEETRIARVMQRDGCSRASVLSRMAAQAPLATKLALADYVVDNDGTPEATAREVARMLAKLA